MSDVCYKRQKSSRTQHYGWRPEKLISSECPSCLRVNLLYQFLLLTVIQVSSFGVVTSSYLDSTTWPSRRCSRSLRTIELSSTVATVYANLSKEGRKGSSFFYFVTVATPEIMTWQFHHTLLTARKLHKKAFLTLSQNHSDIILYCVKSWKCIAFPANIFLVYRSSGQAWFPENPNSEKLFITASSVNRSGSNLYR